VTVPASVWKVILVLDRGEDEDPVKWVDADARLIAVMMSNDTSVAEDDWGRYRCTVAKVEKQTGLKFFDKFRSTSSTQKRRGWTRPSCPSCRRSTDRMADKVLASLRKAARGLLFPSETDAPFEAFVWDTVANSAPSVRARAGRPAVEKGRVLSLDAFLGDLAGEEEFRRLRDSLRDTLTEIKVYRFGAVQPTYYIVGTDSVGRVCRAQDVRCGNVTPPVV
jgi:Nuclease A inhibitor-like protein/DNA/RNA non-specific endonuclease